MARLQPVSAQFKIALQATEAETHKLIVAVAKREHAKVMETPPKPVSFDRRVDGHLNAPEESVKSNGVIVYSYQRLDVIVQYAMDVLFDKSPVLTGVYRNNHTLLINGAPARNLAEYSPGDEITIANPVPYARKIEVGSMQMTVPGTDHVYQQAAQLVKARYGNMARISFTFRSISHSKFPPSRKNRYPALLIAEY
jgi:hypothetical protein